MKWIMQSLYYIIIKPLPIVLFPDKIYFDYLKVSLMRRRDFSLLNRDYFQILLRCLFLLFYAHIYRVCLNVCHYPGQYGAVFGVCLILRGLDR